ncbi:MAG: YheT family hydrolase [Gammaproteobacteria bacterium]
MNAPAHGRIQASAFRPPRGLTGANRQTLLGGVPHLPRLHPLRERWELPDGDFLDLDWIRNEGKSWGLVLPGLTGGLDSPYASRVLKRFAAAGWRAALLNYRGLSGRPNRLAIGYHAGFTRDLDLVARRFAARYGPGAVIGYSMGGGIVLKWLGESGAAAPLTAAAAVSVPFRLAPTSDSLRNGEARGYGRYLLRGLRRHTRRKFAQVSPPFLLPPLGELESIYDFDERITAPLHGFDGANDYYERTSCLPWLRRIAVPTLIVNALDDPLIPRETLPAATDLSPSVTLELSAHGGHVGFLGHGRFGLPRFWLDDRLLDFLESREPRTTHRV